MKTSLQLRSGFTWVEMLVVIATLALLGMAFLPLIARPKARAKRINCVSNLKQIGLAFRMFSYDHEEKFPWRVPASKGGAEIPPAPPDLALQYLAVRTNIASGRVLACASDDAVVKNTNLLTLARANISYFLCLEADENYPQNLLSGDRNITGGTSSNGIYFLASHSGRIGWGTNIHRFVGNLALSDGSAQQVTSGSLNKQLGNMSNEKIRLLLP